MSCFDNMKVITEPGGCFDKIITAPVVAPVTDAGTPSSQAYNTAQACSAECEDGAEFTYTVPAGMFIGANLALANAEALAFACRKATEKLVCLGELESACQDQAYEGTVTVSRAANTTALSWSIYSGALPAGLTFTPAADGQSVTIAGTPTTLGDATFVIQIIENDAEAPGAFGVLQKELSITVEECASAATLVIAPECVGICYAENVGRYYVNEMINTVLTVGIIDVFSMTRTGGIVVGSGTTGAVRMFALYHNGKVYVGRSDTGGKFVTVIDPTTDTVITDIPMTGGGSFMTPADAVYCPTSDRIYVAAGQGVVVIDPNTNTQSNYISLGSSNGAAAVDYYPGEDRIFAVINTGTSKPIYEIDPVTETLVTSFGTNGFYNSLRFHPDGYLYAINNLSQVRRWSISSGVRTFEGSMNFVTPSGGNPRWLHVPYDDNGILVSTDKNNEMYRINEVTHAAAVSSGIFGYDELFNYSNPWSRFAEHDAGGGAFQLFMSGLDGTDPFEGVKRITSY